MADKHQEQEVDDPVGEELEESIKANEALLAGVRYDLGQRVQAAVEAAEQGGEGEMPSAIELAALKKLEQQLDNDKMFARARKMTRRPRR